jgi:hypothetical protein
MADIGRVRLQRRKDGRERHFLDFSPYLKGPARYLMSDRGHRFEGPEHAERVLGWIQGMHGRGLPLEDAVAEYRHPRSRHNLLPERIGLWITAVERDPDYEPYTVAAPPGPVRQIHPQYRVRVPQLLDVDAAPGPPATTAGIPAR